MVAFNILVLGVMSISTTSLTIGYTTMINGQELLVIENGTPEGENAINLLKGGKARAESFSVNKTSFIDSISLNLDLSGPDGVDAPTAHIQVFNTNSSLLPVRPITTEVNMVLVSPGLQNFTNLNWVVDPLNTYNNTFYLSVYAIHSQKTITWRYVLDSTNGDQADVYRWEAPIWVKDDNGIGGDIDYILQLEITTPPDPIVSIVSPLAQAYGTNTIKVAFSGNCPHYWYYIEGVDNQNQTWVADLDRVLTDGSYTLHAYGNNSFDTISTVSVIFTVDTVAPVVVIKSPIAKTYKTDIISINLSGDAGTYWYYIEGIDTINQTWIESTDRVIPDGTYTMHAYGNDSAGNIGHSTAGFIIDTSSTTDTSSVTIPVGTSGWILPLVIGALVTLKRSIRSKR